MLRRKSDDLHVFVAAIHNESGDPSNTRKVALRAESMRHVQRMFSRVAQWCNDDTCGREEDSVGEGEEGGEGGREEKKGGE